MSDPTDTTLTVAIAQGRFKRGDEVRWGTERLVVVRADGTTLTVRNRRWYDGPRLWLRSIPSRVETFITRWLSGAFGRPQ